MLNPAKRIRPFLLCLLTAMLLTTEPTWATEQWGLFELTLDGPIAANPYGDAPFSAQFRQGNTAITAPGFYDGDGRYRVRFSPPTTGRWDYVTSCNLVKLDNRLGSLIVSEPSGGNHGPIEIHKTFYLRYADGTRYHQFGTTCYAWIHQAEALQQQTLKTLAAAPFNKIRFCVFPKSYAYNKNDPDLFAFRKKADGTFDFGHPDPAFWRHLEARILNLQKLGIEADIILWHPYDRWGFADMSDTEDNRYLRYCIARLSAFRNVWWSLANEYDFMTDRPRGHRGNKQMGDWDRFFSILDKEDPYQRMRGIHNGRLWYDHTQDWVIHASLQTSNMSGGVRYRQQYQKPVLYDECKYEGNIPQGWGNIDARTMAQRFWLGTMGGCYVGHGETYKHAEDILWWSKGGVLHGESPQRIQWLKDFMKTAPPFHELVPMGDDRGRFMLGKENEYYLVYCLAGQTVTLELPGNQPYKVDTLDPWEMTEWPLGSLRNGPFTAVAAEHDRVYRFMPYAPGEAMRPEAQPTASVTEGIAPLTVAFQSNTPHRVAWDFKDGTHDNRPNPKHTFQKPGIYTVDMTVTDDRGSTARGNTVILVDRDSSAAIVQVGFDHENQPALDLQGTAKRTDQGAFHFPQGKPWGRAEAKQEASEPLGGLRSFTIMGWLKPEAMDIGSGGNRILFCLQRNRAGIDLVHLADGRMRLAVNEWPDSVKNDSSPGKLVRGQWTYFKVTYDATSHRDNVGWCFSKPMNRPTATPNVELDRRTTYNVGAVAKQTGPLAIGNFNRSMQNHGWDRQFRGEIRELEVFGSRISGRGVLEMSCSPPRTR